MQTHTARRYLKMACSMNRSAYMVCVSEWHPHIYIHTTTTTRTQHTHTHTLTIKSQSSTMPWRTGYFTAYPGFSNAASPMWKSADCIARAECVVLCCVCCVACVRGEYMLCVACVCHVASLRTRGSQMQHPMHRVCSALHCVRVGRTPIHMYADKHQSCLFAAHT